MDLFASQARFPTSSSLTAVAFTPTTTPQRRDHQVGANMNGLRFAPQQPPPHSTHCSPADSRSLSSRGSNHISSSSSRTSLSSSNAEFSTFGAVSLPPSGHAINGKETAETTKVYSYYLNRGDGQFTRLVPADMLPPLSGIAPREEEHTGMVILPPLKEMQFYGNGHKGSVSQLPVAKQPLSLSDNLQNQIDCIVAATSLKSTRKAKIYCDKWIHEGVCAFTQQGCKFKHEMPEDEATQKSLGLFHGYPAWWKKRAEDQQKNSIRRAAAGLGAATTSSSSVSPNFLVRPVSTSSYVNGSETKIGPYAHVQVQQPPALVPCEERGIWPQRIDPVAVESVSASESVYGRASGFARPSGSQWMQNGIVPGIRGPKRAY